MQQLEIGDEGGERGRHPIQTCLTRTYMHIEGHGWDDGWRVPEEGGEDR